MRQRHLVTAFVLSLALHAVLTLALLWGVKPRLRRETAAIERRPLEIQIVHLPPESPAPAPRPPGAPSPAVPSANERARSSGQSQSTQTPAQPSARSSQPRAERAPSPVQPPAALTPREDARTRAPDEGAANGRLSLLPRDSVGKKLEVPSHAEPGGRTIHPDDPSLSEWAKRAEEEVRVKERVDGWADDAAAEARAQRGLPHPYLTEVREALRGGLNSADGGTPAALGGPHAIAFLVNRYRNAAEQYGRTGDPGAITPGQAPRQTEKQKELFGNERAADWTRLYTQSLDTLQNLAYGAPLLALTLELRQRPSGQILSGKVLESSRSAKFDAFVLRVVPEALAGLGPVPGEALRGRSELRSVWRIQGWARLPRNIERAMELLGSPGVNGIPMDVLGKQLAAHEQFDFRALLLRAY